LVIIYLYYSVWWLSSCNVLLLYVTHTKCLPIKLVFISVCHLELEHVKPELLKIFHFIYCIINFFLIRCFSIGNNSEKGEHLKPPGGLKTYIVKKYVSYIERCQVKAKEDYPKFYKIYRLFKDGMLIYTSLWSSLFQQNWVTVN